MLKTAPTPRERHLRGGTPKKTEILRMKEGIRPSCDRLIYYFEAEERQTGSSKTLIRQTMLEKWK